MDEKNAPIVNDNLVDNNGNAGDPIQHEDDTKAIAYNDRMLTAKFVNLSFREGTYRLQLSKKLQYIDKDGKIQLAESMAFKEKSLAFQLERANPYFAALYSQYRENIYKGQPADDNYLPIGMAALYLVDAEIKLQPTMFEAGEVVNGYTYETAAIRYDITEITLTSIQTKEVIAEIKAACRRG